MHHQDGSDSPTVQRTHLSVSPPSAQRRAPVTQWLVRPGVYLVLTLLLTFHHSDLYADRSGGLGPPGPPSFSVFISPLPPTPSRSPDPPLTERSKTHRPASSSSNTSVSRRRLCPFDRPAPFRTLGTGIARRQPSCEWRSVRGESRGRGPPPILPSNLSSFTSQLARRPISYLLVLFCNTDRMVSTRAAMAHATQRRDRLAAPPAS